MPTYLGAQVPSPWVPRCCPGANKVPTRHPGAQEVPKQALRHPDAQATRHPVGAIPIILGYLQQCHNIDDIIKVKLGLNSKHQFCVFFNVNDPYCTQGPRHLGAQVPRYPGAQLPRCLGAQGPRCSGAQVPRCLGAQLPRRLGRTQEPRHPGTQAPRRPGTQVQVLRRSGAETPRRSGSQAPSRYPCACRCPGDLVPSQVSRFPGNHQVPRFPDTHVPRLPGAHVPSPPGARCPDTQEPRGGGVLTLGLGCGIWTKFSLKICQFNEKKEHACWWSPLCCECHQGYTVSTLNKQWCTILVLSVMASCCWAVLMLGGHEKSPS